MPCAALFTADGNCDDFFSCDRRGSAIGCMDGMRFAQGEVGKSLGSFSMGADGLIERGFQLESGSGKTMPGEMSGP